MCNLRELIQVVRGIWSAQCIARGIDLIFCLRITSVKNRGEYKNGAPTTTQKRESHAQKKFRAPYNQIPRISQPNQEQTV